MYAIVRDGSRQVRVEKDGQVRLDRRPLQAGARIELTEVLLLHDGTQAKVGNPTVPGAKVVGEVVSETKEAKIRVHRYRRREGYHKTVGHRQKHTLVRITDILGA